MNNEILRYCVSVYTIKLNIEEINNSVINQHTPT